MKNDEFGARMKEYEAVETSRKFYVTLPVYARLDGRGFSKFTRGMNRPFDHRMTNAMVAQAEFSHKDLHGKSQADMLKMLDAKGIDFEANPVAFKRGAFIRRVLVERDAAASDIPEQFRPEGPIIRAEYQVIDMPAFNTVTNRVEVVFGCAIPVARPTISTLVALFENA